MPVKREASPSPTGYSDESISDRSPSATQDTPSPSPSHKKRKTTTPKDCKPVKIPTSSPSKGRPGAKARLAPEVKRIIAERIINCGVMNLDIEKLELETGLNKQQIKSQLADNRQNLRRQLMELARGLQ